MKCRCDDRLVCITRKLYRRIVRISAYSIEAELLNRLVIQVAQWRLVVMIALDMRSTSVGVGFDMNEYSSSRSEAAL